MGYYTDCCLWHNLSPLEELLGVLSSCDKVLARWRTSEQHRHHRILLRMGQEQGQGKDSVVHLEQPAQLLDFEPVLPRE